jgi:predicted RNase H-like HicB family nuclease
MSTGAERPSEIVLTREGDGWVATETESGVTSQGETRDEALEMLDDAIAVHYGEVGDPVESADEEYQVLEELGIDPDEVEQARAETGELPEFMQ